MTLVGLIADMIYGIACLISGLIGLFVIILYFDKGVPFNDTHGAWLLLAAAVWFFARLIRYALTGK
jgi:hypothetical protein